MTMPEQIVPPPTETPSLYGLFSAARLLPLAGHEQFGIVYDALCDYTPHIWPGACNPAADPVSTTRTITVGFTGSHIAGPPERWVAMVGADVDSGPDRTLTVSYATTPPVKVVTGDPSTLLGEYTAVTNATARMVDDRTGTVHTADLVMDPATGAFTPSEVTFTVTDVDAPQKVAGGAAFRVHASPLVVYGAEQCLMGLTFEEIVARARRRLEITEQTAVERAFWTGEYGTFPALATSEPEILPPSNTGVAVDIVTAVSRLEEWLGFSGVTGYLHASRGVAAVAASHDLYRIPQGTRLETHLGNVWVFGGGYGHSGPTGQPVLAPYADQAWIYATRQVTVRRTEIIMPAEMENGSAVNWRHNEAFLVAERTYVVDFPCKSAAILVDLTK